MNTVRIALTALAGLLGFAAVPADAAITLIKISGVMDFGSDELNYFGAGQDIGGLTAVLTFRVDDEGQVFLGQVGNESSAASYSAFHTVPGVTASVTVNDHEVALSGFNRALVQHLKNTNQPFSGAMTDEFHAVADWSGGWSEGEAIYYDLYSKVSLFAQPNWRQFTDFTIPADAFSSRAGFSFYHEGKMTGGEFMTGHITTEIEPEAPSPTPEPASWAMMLAGFGVIGGMVRRRNRSMCTA